MKRLKIVTECIQAAKRQILPVNLIRFFCCFIVVTIFATIGYADYLECHLGKRIGKSAAQFMQSVDRLVHYKMK